MSEDPTILGAVIELLQRYEDAANHRNTAAFRSILALDDGRFREIEDHIPDPFGREVAEDILRWIDANPGFGYQVSYRNVEVYALGDSYAYAIAMNDWESPNGSGSARATFILHRDQGGSWRILHGHWSAVPQTSE